MNHPEHSSAVKALLNRVDEEHLATMKLGCDVLKADDGNLFPMDLLVIGTLKRFASTSTAFQLMISTWNLTCARALLRMHIDTSLRFSAAWLVEEPHAFASEILRGSQINYYKDSTGKRLSDKYLIDKRSSEYPWLPTVYQNLSGFVHLSRQHIFAAVTSLDDSSHEMHFTMGDDDTKYPEFSWLEAIEYFLKATNILQTYLAGYRATKQYPGTKHVPPSA